MFYLVIALLIVVLTMGISLGVYSIRNSRSIYYGVPSTRQKRLVNACSTGLSASMLLMSLILFAGLLDHKYIWSIEKILLITLFSLIPGVIVTLGTIWGFFIVNVYRNKVITKIIYKKKEPD